ncbi:MAG: hypothetical protein OEY59_12770 [Deltaproteobacteria bacterium]|nr:hypothetical protein [Deltaproteobacteria bacterium]
MNREERERKYKEIDAKCTELEDIVLIEELIKEGFDLATQNDDKDFVMFFKSLGSLYNRDHEVTEKAKKMKIEKGPKDQSL